MKKEEVIGIEDGIAIIPHPLNRERQLAIYINIDSLDWDLAAGVVLVPVVWGSIDTLLLWRE